MPGGLIDLDLLKTVVNASLCVLIWIVQLVIYPGFCYYNEAEIKQWHKIYTTRITYIVLPLMLSQLVLYVFSSYYQPLYESIGILLLVILMWIVTFFVAVPLHKNIDISACSLGHRKKLVKVNWIRTIGWSLILIISLATYGE